MIGLFGARRITVTTRRWEASCRDRYLDAASMNHVSASRRVAPLHRIPTRAAGLLGTLLRFIPYVVWIDRSSRCSLSIFDGWTEVMWVLSAFLVLELVLVNAVEPWLYGRSAGLSAIAVIAAALFWTWLWGPVGLLLAVPLTVCIAVMGRYIPEMGWLDTLLGVEPVLAPEARFYQRLIALDDEEAMALADMRASTRRRAVRLGSRRRCRSPKRPPRRGARPRAQRFVLDTVREIVDEIAEKERKRSAGAGTCRILPAHDEADGWRRDAGAAAEERSSFRPRAWPEMLDAWARSLASSSASAQCRRRLSHAAYRAPGESGLPTSRSWSRCSAARASTG
jgi:hypothetical protein